MTGTSAGPRLCRSRSFLGVWRRQEIVLCVYQVGFSFCLIEVFASLSRNRSQDEFVSSDRVNSIRRRHQGERRQSVDVIFHWPSDTRERALSSRWWAILNERERGSVYFLRHRPSSVYLLNADGDENEAICSEFFSLSCLNTSQWSFTRDIDVRCYDDVQSIE